MREYNPSEVMNLVNSNPTRAAVMLAEMVQERDEYIKNMQNTIDELNIFLESVARIMSKINEHKSSIPPPTDESSVRIKFFDSKIFKASDRNAAVAIVKHYLSNWMQDKDVIQWKWTNFSDRHTKNPNLATVVTEDGFPTDAYALIIE